MLFQHLLLLMAGLVAITPPSETVNFYVTPTHPPDQACPNQPCLTLDHYAQNASLFEGQTNVSLLFLSGQHNLTHHLNIAGLDDLTIGGLHCSSSVNNFNAVIDLQANIYVNSVLNFRLCNIKMEDEIGFMTYIRESGDFYYTQYIRKIHVRNVSSLIQNNVELKYTVLNVFEDGDFERNIISIFDCNYHYSQLNFTTDNSNIQITRTNISNELKGSFLAFGLYLSCPSRVQNVSAVSLAIDNSTINGWGIGLGTRDCNQMLTMSITNTQFIQNNHGAVIVASNVDCLLVRDSHFVDNQIGLYLQSSNLTHVTVQNTHFTNNIVYGLHISNANNVNSFFICDSHFVDTQLIGLYLMFQSNLQKMMVRNTIFRNTGYAAMQITPNQFHKSLIEMDNITVTGNPIGVLVYEFPSSSAFEFSIQIKNSRIDENSFGIVLITTSDLSAVTISVLIQNCDITLNQDLGMALVNFQGSTIVKDCNFYNNKGTPIQAFRSKLELSGETSFVDNVAVRGGALSLIHSTVQIANNSNITFQNNTAMEFGGAIHVVSLKSLVQTVFNNLVVDVEQFDRTVFDVLSCFYQFDVSNLQDFSTLQTKVNFVNNTARLGGEEIYGASLNERCKYSKDSQDILNEAMVQEIFKVNPSKPSPISSDPTRVCFCAENSTTMLCDKKLLVHYETRYPGERFTVPLVLVGYDFGTVTGSIHANILNINDSPQTLLEELLVQELRAQSAEYHECNDLKYSIQSRNSYEIIKFTAQLNRESENGEEEISKNKYDINHHLCRDNDQCTALLTTPIYVNVTLEDCPLGFKLNENLTCGCDDTLNDIRNNTQSNITCEIRNHIGFISREGTLWVGVDNGSEDTSVYNWHIYCPRDYCNNERTSIELTNPDTQCNFNRSGDLCGRCKDNFSLPLGSNRCRECEDNNELAFLVFFVAAGFLLVFFIKFLDITVANGTINGFVFYANVLWGYNSILLSTQNRDSVLYQILTVPIAWINLDFGIETCFFDGMDAFSKTWLQFVFPLYIWSIAGLIILVSHYSTRVTKLFGNNSVAVLATLFLLSYGKILVNTINILSYADINYSDNRTRGVWSVDGTLQYGTSKHGALLAVALMVLLFLWLPYTLTLLLVPCLRSKSNLKPLRWINTLKPFFDTYYGPFNDKVQFQCWTGDLLLVRGVLLVILAFTATSNPFANILSLVIMAIVLLMCSATFGQLYNKWYLSLSENVYILNLGVLGGGFLFYQLLPKTEQRNDINPVTAVSISFALFQFICIILFHLVKKFLSFKNVCVDIKKPKKKETPQPTHQVVEVQALDDPLKEDNNYRDSILEYITEQ